MIPPVPITHTNARYNKETYKDHGSIKSYFLQYFPKLYSAETRESKFPATKLHYSKKS